MKPSFTMLLALHLFAAYAGGSSRPRYMRTIAAAGGGESCAILDAAIFAHAAPSLKDLRLVADGVEIPYFVTLSETADMTDDMAEVIGARTSGAQTTFDLRMPPRAYTDVDLDLHQQDFVVTATVSGSDELPSVRRVPLGTFTLFDLSRRHLSRETVLPLQESTFRFLHVELHGTPLASTAILAARVPPSRQRQTLYSPVLETSRLSREAEETVATVRVPAHVPLERVSIELTPGYPGNFDRRVRVTGRADGPDGPVETIEGRVARVHLGKVQQQQMSFAAAMGVNLQHDATIRIAIENGKEAPLPISALRFEMRRRSICFSTPPTAPVLFYGDPTLGAPDASAAPPALQGASMVATLGPEMRNPDFQERPRSVLAKRPDLLWLLVLAGFGVAGTIALHSLRRRSLHPR